MKAMRGLTIAGLVVLTMAAGARAHWDDSMPFKMHFPQHPAPDGWDIDMTNYVLADDWLCTQTGPVKDIHFWYSVRQDDDAGKPIDPPHFSAVNVSIHDDIATGPQGFSIPGALRWEDTFTNFVLAGPFFGWQGYDDPQPGSPCEYDDHCWYWQVNITDIADPFVQDAGNIYWLDLQVQGLANGYVIGWKTSNQHFRDFAVYGDPAAPAGWSQIAVCANNELTDLAFVITPEPATLALMALGGAAMVVRRRRSR